MRVVNKCEICGSPIDEKDVESISFRGTVTYVCPRCMHRIISYMTILKCYVDMKLLKQDFPNIPDMIDEIKKMLMGKVKKFRRIQKKN